MKPLNVIVYYRCIVQNVDIDACAEFVKFVEKWLKQKIMSLNISFNDI